MKMKKEAMIVAYRILNNAKLSKMDGKEKYLVIRAMKQLKPVATDYDDFLKDAAQRLRPDGYEAIEAKQDKDLTEEEREVVDKYNTEISECVREELNKEVELGYKPLTEEAFGRFADSNDISLAELMAVDEVLVFDAPAVEPSEPAKEGE